ncbi:unnamed protein product [Polarella glacialis]|uniref:Uncharacterized protein n=1 Tax=Polarella glacialis TaxID=89957 RepID=A0A813IVH4_POLGL|nr:unnamed protein product [Polarella glacialis]
MEALHAASAAGDALGLHAILLDASGDVHVNGRHGARDETALHAACRASDVGAEECCKLLLAAGADPAIRCIHGGSCLHQAAQFHNDCAVTAMLQIPAPSSLPALVNMQDKNGWTALHAAVYKQRTYWLDGSDPQRRVAIVTTLLRARADAGLRNNAGQTVFELAVASNCHDGLSDLLRPASSAVEDPHIEAGRRDNPQPEAEAPEM